MNATEAALVVREYLYGVCGALPDIGFEVIDTSQYDFHEWEIKCFVFDMLTSRMVSYIAVISDDKVESIRKI